jgi:hypothetical protein
MRWRTRAGDELAASLGEPLTNQVTNQAWRTALDPGGEWIAAVLRAADRRLTEVRRQVPDAGAMVIATDQAAARAYGRLLRELTGTEPVVVLSDDARASGRIEEFAAGEQRWLVAVRMVSEGVDIPRLAVGVYATNASTPLFFAQAVGRFVRARRRGEIASVFLPTVAPLLKHAAELELTRDHVLGHQVPAEGLFAPEEKLLAAANRSIDAADGLGEFTALASAANFDRVMFGGAEFGLACEPGSPEEQDFLGLPGLLDADQIADLLRRRQAKQLRAAARRSDGSPVAEPAERRPVATHAERSALRRQLHSLVGAWAGRSGASHAAIHAELRRETGGPATAAAGVDDLRRRVDSLRHRLAP